MKVTLAFSSRRCLGGARAPVSIKEWWLDDDMARTLSCASKALLEPPARIAWGFFRSSIFVDLFQSKFRPTLHMIRHDNRARIFATCLSVLAGYVDAVGFLSLGGFFVSFMSGNSTRLGVGIAAGSGDALVAAALIGAFVLGVMTASIVGVAARGLRIPAVLGFVSILLLSGATLASLGIKSAALGAMAMAMGAENAVFEREGEVSIGVTYMTGTLVKFGQRLAAALLGGERLAWAPYLLLWIGLVTGATAGAASFPKLGLGALWIAAISAAILAGISPGVDRARSDIPLSRRD